MNRGLLPLLTAGALCALATPAFAHAMLERATPGAGANVAAPAELRLRYSEGVEPSLCQVQLTDVSGHAEALGALSLSPDHLTLIAPVRNHLAPGVYHVRWRAVSVDTHITSGDFNFRVTP
jgi:methionine-rich copper-binding protein CopC